MGRRPQICGQGRDQSEFGNAFWRDDAGVFGMERSREVDRGRNRADYPAEEGDLRFGTVDAGRAKSDSAFATAIIENLKGMAVAK